MVSSPGVYLYQRTTYFGEAPDPMYRTIRLTVYWLSVAVEIFERLLLLAGRMGTSEAEWACGHVCIWRGCDKGFDVSRVGAWNTRSMSTVLGILSSFMKTVQYWMLKTRNGPSVQPNKLL